MELKPSLSEFKLLARQGNLIPLHHEFLSDTETPVSAYLKIRDRSFSYLLESSDSGTTRGRYSYIGYRPFVVVISRKDDVEVAEKNGRSILKGDENPLLILRELNRKFRPVGFRGLSPFRGGFVGYCNYSLVRKWENLRYIVPEEANLPEAIFTLCRRLIIFDHVTHHVKVVAFIHLTGGEDLEGVYLSACLDIHETIGELRLPTEHPSEGDTTIVSPLEADSSREDFEEAVRRAKRHIVAGDVIQVVLSQRFSGKVNGDGFTIYRNLRSINPAPYLFYLNFGEVKLIGSSPEILVRLVDRRIELRPIAGTRQRGKTPAEDVDLERELVSDPKERAEHVMLVDLGRNDVGKAAMPGSVSVPRLMYVERCSHVMHIVSTVQGLLKTDMDAFDLFMATFPAGTVTGAPKIRAMEIIGELESTQRGPYAGAVGYFGFDGNMDFCITIRTIAIIGQWLSVQAGAGIVADSVPEKEYEETLRKAAAMFKAVARVSER